MMLNTESQQRPQARPLAQHGARQLKAEETVRQTLEQSRTWKGDRLKDLQRVARQITGTKKNPFRYAESREIKELRAEAMRRKHTPEARALWKEVWRRKKQHRDQWHRELLQEALRNNWHALQAIKRSRKPTMWMMNLTAEEGWQKRMRTHFESIFRKQEGERVKQGVRAVWERLERLCKDTPWEPFTPEELASAMANWKGGKSTRPDGVSFEALKAMYQDTQWRGAILHELNDDVYKGKLPPDLKESITVLIPKEANPKQWSETRPITLSTSCLKWQSQLILARTTEHIFQGVAWQYAQPGKRPAELILSIRKAVRTCREWGLPLHLIKIDVAKAFDTASQVHLASMVEQQVGLRGGRPWEARAWIDLLANDCLSVSVADEIHGVAPVAFAAMVGQILNEVLGPPPEHSQPNPPHAEDDNNGARPPVRAAAARQSTGPRPTHAIQRRGVSGRRLSLEP